MIEMFKKIQTDGESSVKNKISIEHCHNNSPRKYTLTILRTETTGKFIDKFIEKNNIKYDKFGQLDHQLFIQFEDLSSIKCYCWHEKHLFMVSIVKSLQSYGLHTWLLSSGDQPECSCKKET